MAEIKIKLVEARKNNSNQSLNPQKTLH